MNVRAAREAKGWSQEHLAAAAGVSLRTVQRVEAGSRASPDNTLALCAALGIEPVGLLVPPSTDAGTLPHLQVLRGALDKALAEFGERPLWRKADASPALLRALARMDLPGNADGFAEAARRVGRTHGSLQLSKDLFHPLAVAWCIWSLMLPSALMALYDDFQGRVGTIGVILLAWLVVGTLLGIAIAFHAKAHTRICPVSPGDVEAAGIILSDIHPVEAALTRDFLWVCEMGPGGPRVIRMAIAGIREVTVVLTADGSHSARFRVDGTRPLDNGMTTTYELTRLRDGEAKWLDRRFGTMAGPVVWTPAMA